MFHWICPECGREIAPTVRECPACDPAAATVESALAGEVEALARASDEVPAIAPDPLADARGSVSSIPSTEPRLEGADSGHDVPPALAARVQAVSPRPARNSNRLPEAETPEALLPEFGAPAAGGDPLDHLSTMLDSMEPEPPPSRNALPLPMRAVPTVPASLRAFIAELQPAGAKPNAPLNPLQRVQAAPEPPLLTSPVRLPLRSSRQSAAPPLGAKLLALAGPPLELVRPWTPPLELAPAMAPLGNYSPLAGRPLRPAIPHNRVLKKDYWARTTLPGPMLTRRLVNFADRELSAIPPSILRAKKRLIPGWMASALIIGTLLGAGFTSVISVVRPSADGKQPSVTEAAAPVTPSVSTSPAAQPIEVTGFRIQMDPTKKSEIQYLVVNHTASRFTGVTVNVTLYAADAKAGQPPVCKFQFVAPNLGPFQSKDMTSAIEQVTRPVTLPDWQDLRAAVEIAQ